MSQNKVIGLTVNIGEFVIGTLLKETDTHIELVDVVVPGVNQIEGNIKLNFFHADMIAVNPPVGARNFISDPNEAMVALFDKSRIIFKFENLSAQTIQNYHTFFGRNVPQITEQTTNPDENVINLF